MQISEPISTSDTSSLSLRLNRHFVACSAAAACVAGVAAPKAEAAVVYSGVQNLALPMAGGGQLYLNLVSGLTGPNSGALLDWDIAPYGGGLTNQPSYAMTTVTLNGTSSANLAPGTLIDGSSSLMGSTGGIQNIDIPNNTTGIIGFKFNPASTDGFTPAPNGTPTNYGWFRMEVNTTTGGKIVDWAYESTPGVGITAPVPEPSALGCLALGAIGLTTMRRRKAAQAA
jgi:hypothetical protein